MAQRIPELDDQAKLIYLISGSGIPRDAQYKPRDNSTLASALLLKAYITALYPVCNVIHVGSGDNVYRAEHNTRFVNEKLRPLLDKQRRLLAKRYSENWRKTLPPYFGSDIRAARSHPRTCSVPSKLRTRIPSRMEAPFILAQFCAHRKRCRLSNVRGHGDTTSHCNCRSKWPLQVLVSEMLKYADEFRASLAGCIERDFELLAKEVEKASALCSHGTVPAFLQTITIVILLLLVLVVVVVLLVVVVVVVVVIIVVVLPSSSSSSAHAASTLCTWIHPWEAATAAMSYME